MTTTNEWLIANGAKQMRKAKKEIKTLKSQKAALLAACKASLEYLNQVTGGIDTAEDIEATENIVKSAIEQAEESGELRSKAGRGMESLENELDDAQQWVDNNPTDKAGEA